MKVKILYANSLEFLESEINEFSARKFTHVKDVKINIAGDGYVIAVILYKIENPR